MRPWLEALGVLLICIGGILLGWFFSRLRKPYWLLGYCLPISVVFLFALANQLPGIVFDAPVAWMFTGRTRFIVFGFVAAMALTTPLSRLPRKRMRLAVSVLIGVVVWELSVWPFLAPAFNYNYLSHLQTRIDADGICRQSTDYDCGPAAAVTALRKLGLPAEEGKIAILTHTTSTTGTEPSVLAAELQKRYGKDGLTAEFRAFTNVAELKDAGLTLAVVKFNFLVDHFVTVLEVTKQEVVVGDPLNGKVTLSWAEFEDKWRFIGVVLRRRR